MARIAGVVTQLKQNINHGALEAVLVSSFGAYNPTIGIRWNEDFSIPQAVEYEVDEGVNVTTFEQAIKNYEVASDQTDKAIGDAEKLKTAEIRQFLRIAKQKYLELEARVTALEGG